MLLHYTQLQAKHFYGAERPSIILLHGLFGEGKNLSLLALRLQEHFNIISVDLRNHGHSFKSDDHNYDLMAGDIVKLTQHLNLNSFSLVGHSMGGKVAMKLAGVIPEQINKLAILDIAPVAYEQRKHDEIFKALNLATQNQVSTRLEASKYLSQFIESTDTIQFLLKSFDSGHWRFNLPALEAHYEEIIGWETITPYFGDTLFLIGGSSDYVQLTHRDRILAQFPNARSHVIAGANHWLHADKPERVSAKLIEFLLEDNLSQS